MGGGGRRAIPGSGLDFHSNVASALVWWSTLAACSLPFVSELLESCISFKLNLPSLLHACYPAYSTPLYIPTDGGQRTLQNACIGNFSCPHGSDALVGFTTSTALITEAPTLGVRNEAHRQQTWASPTVRSSSLQIGVHAHSALCTKLLPIQKSPLSKR